ncbi:MAG: hypothetical protein RLZZ306_1552 [Bacteroidota bacterium]|jgi:hypothetical protein
MKFKLTKTLIFACIIMSTSWGFTQTFDRDSERNNRRSGSTEEVTGIVNTQKKNNFHQLGTNFQTLSNIGANIEYTGYGAISKPNEMGDQALYLGTTYGIGYGSVGIIDLLSANADITLNYKIPLNDDNLKILLGAGAGYYSLFALGTNSDSISDFVFVARSSFSYFLAPTIGIFGSATKAGSGDISFSAGLVFRRAR